MKKLFLIILVLYATTPIVFSDNLESPVHEGKEWDGISKCNEDSPNYMFRRTSLTGNGCLVSKNGVFKLVTREWNSIGIVMTNAPGTNVRGAAPTVTYWNTADKGPKSPQTILDLNHRGTLAVYNKGISAGGKSQWTSGTGGTGADTLILTDWGELVLQRESESEPEWDKGENPTLNPNGRYKHRYIALNRNRFIKGFAGIHTPTVGMQVIAYDIDNITKTESIEDFQNSHSAHDTVFNCGQDATNHLTGERNLSSQVTDSESWGESTSTSNSSTFGIEVGLEIGPDEFKSKVSAKVEHTLTSQNTKERSSSKETTRSESSAVHYDVSPGTYQSYSMIAKRITYDVPYSALAVVQPTGHGRYVTRNKIDDTFTDTDAYGADIRAGDVISCKKQ